MSEMTNRLQALELYAQLYEEWGAKDVEALLAAVDAAIGKALAALHGSAVDAALAAREPDEFAAIKALRPKASSRMHVRLSATALREKLGGAMLARFAGCTLGAIVEGWPVARMEKWAALTGDAFPPVDYWSRANSPEEIRYGMSPQKSYTRSEMDGFPVDDDITYTLIGLLIAEKYGVDFTVGDVGKAWLDWLPIACTAEDIALKNLKKGISAERAAEIDNPFCQWIGAAIRSDPWGYLAAGWPEKAAEFAWRDAYLSHRRNGIYGEMYLAAAQAAAFATETSEEALRVGLEEIPENCALADDIRWALDIASSTEDWREARARVDGRFGAMSHVHTNNNLCLVALGLLLGGRDVTKVLGEVVAMGMDNDCTAASAGSIVGAIVGASGIPGQWTRGVNNKVYSYINGYPVFAIDDLVERFAAVNEKL